VGANIGDTAVFLLSATSHLESKAILVEPDEACCQICHANVMRNCSNWPQVTVVCKAAVMTPKLETDFWANTSQYNRYRNSSHGAINKKSRKIKVPSCNLPELLSKALDGGDLDTVLLKIDIEGGEFQIIDHMPDLLRVMAKAGILQVRIMLEYTFDADRSLDAWRERRDQMEYYFNTVVTRRTYQFIETVGSQFDTRCPNQADMWYLEANRDRLALWCSDAYTTKF
jgi:FkbM family methyltransferase